MWNAVEETVAEGDGQEDGNMVVAEGEEGTGTGLVGLAMVVGEVEAIIVRLVC